jgi:3-mercaptopyruvate sulfurtransferase SseA
VAQQLASLGYQKVRILKGGLASWVNAGLPLEAKA